MGLTEAQKRYAASEKGKAARKKYMESEKAKATRKKYVEKRKAAKTVQATESQQPADQASVPEKPNTEAQDNV